MKILIRATESQQQILIAKNKTANIVWYNETIENADAYIDLEYITYNNIFENITDKPVLVNDVVGCKSLPNNFFRINAWNTFLEKEKLEIASNNIDATTVLQSLGYNTIEVPNIVGLIAARNISMIINEAYFALEDNVSTKEQIDTAMKLGTNYPFGPFEWEAKIGKQNIIELLQTLAFSDVRYTPCNLLLQHNF